MNKDEYTIINESKLLRKIEEMEKQRDEYSFNPNRTEDYYRYNSMIKVVKEILSQSTPLIPEVEKLIVMSSTSNIDFLPDRVEKIKQDYISNLKLNI